MIQLKYSIVQIPFWKFRVLKILPFISSQLHELSLWETSPIFFSSFQLRLFFKLLINSYSLAKISKISTYIPKFWNNAKFPQLCDYELQQLSNILEKWKAKQLNKNK